MALPCRAMKICLAFGMAIILSSISQAQGSYHSVAHLSDTDRVILTIRQLDRGIQSQNLDLIIWSLSPQLQEDSILVDSVIVRFQQIFDRLDSLQDSQQQAGKSQSMTSSPPTFHIREIEPVMISPTAAQVLYATNLGLNPSHYSATVTLMLDNPINRYGIATIFPLANTLDMLLDSAEAEPSFLFSPIISTGSYGSAKATTDGSLYLKNGIVHPGVSGGPPVCPIFTKAYANTNFGGKNLFSRPYDVFETVINTLGKTYWAMLVSDANWDRIIYLAENENGTLIQALTAYDGSTEIYRFPAGMAALTDQDFYVCDKFNNQIARYWIGITSGGVYWNDTILFVNSDNYLHPVDIDAAHMYYGDTSPDGYSVRNHLAICDQGNHRVVIASLAGIIDKIIGGYGYYPDQLIRPTSVAFGRHFGGWPFNAIYVADAGKRRIVGYFNPNPSSIAYDRIYSTPDDLFPNNAYLSSVEVDNLGNVYTLDSYNGIIYKLNGLLGYIGSWGGIGGGTAELYYPNRIAITKGWHDGNHPILGTDVLLPTQYGDLLVTEFYTDSTGIKRYQFTNSLLSFETGYSPRNCNEADDFIFFEWKQADFGDVNIVISGYLLNENYRAPYGPGDYIYTYPVPYDAPQDATYTIRLTLYSIYDRWNPVITVEQSVQCQRDTCNYPPRLITPPYLVNSDSCVLYGHVYQCAADAEDYNSPSNRLTYKWKSFNGKFDDPMTGEQDFFHDSLVLLNMDRVYIKIKQPATKSYAEPEIIFTIEVSDDMGGQTNGLCAEPIYANESECPYENPPPECPVLYAADQDNWYMINNLLAESEIATGPFSLVYEIYPVYDINIDEAGQIRLRVVEEAQEVTSLRSIRGYMIEYRDSLELIYTVQNHAYARGHYSRKPALAHTASGDTITEILSYEDGHRFTDANAGHIIVTYVFDSEFGPNLKTLSGTPGGPELPPPDKGFLKPRVIRDLDESPFYEVLALDSIGDWISVARLFPRLKQVSHYIEMSDFKVGNQLTMKIEYGSSGIDLDHIPFWYFEPVAVTAYPLSLLSALHSTTGNVASELATDESADVILDQGENVELVFQGSPLAEGHKGIFLMVTTGMYQAPTDYNPEYDEFAFEQNYPNPFNPNTTFRFNLPYACHVNLVIYNVLGQVVKVVRDDWMHAGRHTVVWDGKNTDGEEVASGIYFASFTTSGYGATRKIEVLK